MLVDGKQIASEILNETAEIISKMSARPSMSVLTCAPNFETRKYLEIKQAKAAFVGIDIKVIDLPVDSDTKTAVDCVVSMAKDSNGVVVQLPLPPSIDREMVISAIPPEKDPDGFCYGKYENACLPPVVGAIDVISKKHNIVWKDKQVIVLGEGRLVGLPATAYARNKGSRVITFTKDNFDEPKLKEADIIISGMGQPHSIFSSSVKKDVIVFDAGTSEEGGVIVGDVDTNVAEIASIMTPVPGGIGPITIAYLFHNLVLLTSR